MTRLEKTEARPRVFGMLLTASPFLLTPFAILLAETFIQLQTFQNDYHVNELRQETRALHEEIKALKAKAADLEAMNRLDEQALRLGMVEPERDQIVTLGDRIDGLNDLRFAHLRSESAPAGPAPADP